MSIRCPRCGLVFEADAAHLHVLDDPRVLALEHEHPATHAFLRSALNAFLYPSATIGAGVLSDVAGYDRSGVYVHLRRLTALGVLEAVPKRQGGKYHAYRLNGASR